jgi:hypothetical protein
VQLYQPGQLLEAPGVLKNPVPVEALYDRAAAHAVTLRNLLQRQGYSDLEAVRAASEAEGEAKGRVEGEAIGRLDGRIATLLEQLTAKFGLLPVETVARIENASLEELRLWSVQLLTATTLEEALGMG